MDLSPDHSFINRGSGDKSMSTQPIQVYDRDTLLHGFPGLVSVILVFGLLVFLAVDPHDRKGKIWSSTARWKEDQQKPLHDRQTLRRKERKVPAVVKVEIEC